MARSFEVLRNKMSPTAKADIAHKSAELAAEMPLKTLGTQSQPKTAIAKDKTQDRSDDH